MTYFNVHDFEGSEALFEQFMEGFVEMSIPISVTVNAYDSFEILQGYKLLHSNLFTVA